MNNVDISEALAWLILFLTAWQVESWALHTLIEKVGIKNILKQFETRFGIPAELRQFLIPVATFLVALYGIWQGEINLFVVLPIPILDNAPEWMVWVINALFVSGGAFIDHTWFERAIEAAKKAKEIVDIFVIPLAGGQKVEVKMIRNAESFKVYEQLLKTAAAERPDLEDLKKGFTHAAQ